MLAYYKHSYYVSVMSQYLLGYLISDTGRMIRKEFDERARVLGVTGPQWRLLAQLRREPGMKQAPLAELLEVEPISLSRMIDRLQELGLVERRANPHDRRAWCLHLTAKADPLVDKIKAIADDLHVQMLDGLSKQQLDDIRNMLEHIRNNLSPIDDDRKAVANG